MTETTRNDVLREIVRGDAEIDRLSDLGSTLVSKPDFHLWEPPATDSFQPSKEDVATGLMTYWVRGGDEARLWAKVMLSASNSIDLALLEQTGSGQVLLDAIWQMSGGEDLDDETIDVVRELTNRQTL